ncbi:MAG TPA: molybdate ABC transporter substrate-binding protein [Solirubrobacteraceae bacterium]
MVAGCGGEDDDRPTIYAASSLRSALPAVLPDARYSFGGSNQLRSQIERGAPADVFIGASPKDPAALAKAGKCERPVAVATNELVMIVPAGGERLSLAALARGGHRIAVGAEGVPIGDYTRTLLQRAGATAVLTRNVVSSETSVASIVAKVRAGSADAGFVYVTDVDGVRAVRLPRAAQPTVRYEACAVRAAGRAYVRALRSPAVQRALVDRGFGRAP